METKGKVEQREQQLIAGTSASVLADILGSCEELRWMEPHMSSPSPCCSGKSGNMKTLRTRVRHTHTHYIRQLLQVGYALKHITVSEMHFTCGQAGKWVLETDVVDLMASSGALKL